jgi:hypothetical protein
MAFELLRSTEAALPMFAVYLQQRLRDRLVEVLREAAEKEIKLVADRALADIGADIKYFHDHLLQQDIYELVVRTKKEL